jgi:hypothetical protein
MLGTCCYLQIFLSSMTIMIKPSKYPTHANSSKTLIQWYVLPH